MRSGRLVILFAAACVVSASCGSESASDNATTLASASTLESLPTTTGAAETTLAPETTVPAGGLDLRLVVSPLDLAPSCTPVECGSIAIAPSGEIVLFDRSLATLTFIDQQRVVTVDWQFDDRAQLVTIGPDDVAYFVVSFDDDFGTIKAVATSGPMSGQVVRHGTEAVWMDEFYFAFTPLGIVSVVCCDTVERQPSTNAIPISPWVSAGGVESGSGRPSVWLEYPTVDEMVVNRSDNGPLLQWTPAGLFLLDYMPPIDGTDDGGVVLWFDDTRGLQNDAAVLYDFRSDGSIKTYVTDPSYEFVAMHSSRFVIVFDGEQYLRLQLP